MSPADEAAVKLIRLLNTICASFGRRLGAEHEAAVHEICDLLSTDGTLAPLDDLPRVSPAEAMIEAAERDPGYKRWKEERDQR